MFGVGGEGGGVDFTCRTNLTKYERRADRRTDQQKKERHTTKTFMYVDNNIYLFSGIQELNYI